jgi:acyl carrier protein phosphodiesterase
MNYLAHLFLADDTDESRIGSLLADFTRVPDGRVCEMFGRVIGEGVQRHRRVDAFTDEHPEVNRCVRHLFARHRHAGRIIVDVFFDYLLSLHWGRFSAVPLRTFIDTAYVTLGTVAEPLPERFCVFAKRVVEYDVLARYGTLEGIRLSLERMQSRISVATNLVAGLDHIMADYPLFEEAFLTFFPQVVREAAAHRAIVPAR